MKKSILFTIFNLGKGGAEIIFTTLVENLNEHFNISVLVFSDDGYYEERLRLLDNVKFYSINSKKNNTIKYAWNYRKLLKEIKPDKIISFLWYPNIVSYLANFRLNIPHIPTEHSNHRIYFTASFKHKIWRFLLKRAYKNANKIITVSNQIKIFICEDFKVTEQKAIAIHNGINFEVINQLSNETIDDFNFNPNNKYIIAIGRLFEPKNYTLLLKSYSIIISEKPNVHLIILGDGELKNTLLHQADDLGISKTTHLLGFKSNPYKYLGKSDVYVLSSNREGFPVALIEAMYINGHVVSTNCMTGPAEIISHNLDGLLSENENEVELADNLNKMLFDNELRNKVSINSKEKVKNFDYQIMLKKYNSVLNE